MNQKNKTVIICCAVLAALLSLTGLITKSSGLFTDRSQPYSETQAETVLYESQSYTLGVYKGNIAIFYGDFRDDPAIETDINVEGLRAVDRNLLEQGIVVKTYEEVLQLLEDFGS